MQDTRTLVPSFGHWDTTQDVSYTTIFDMVRAERDRKPKASLNFNRPPKSDRHRSEPKLSRIHSQSERRANSMTLTMASLQQVLKNAANDDPKISLSRMSSLGKMADEIFTESQNAVDSKPPMVLQRSISAGTSWQTRRYMGKDERRRCGKDVAIHYATTKMEVATTRVLSNGRSESVNSSAKRQSQRSILSAGSKSAHVMATLHQQNGVLSLPARSLSSEMQHANRVLPKFGDWDAVGVEFSIIFDRARSEKKSGPPIANAAVFKVATPKPEDEDLYKPKSAPRKQSRMRSFLCCSNPNV